MKTINLTFLFVFLVFVSLSQEEYSKSFIKKNANTTESKMNCLKYIGLNSYVRNFSIDTIYDKLIQDELSKKVVISDDDYCVIEHSEWSDGYHLWINNPPFVKEFKNEWDVFMFTDDHEIDIVTFDNNSNQLILYLRYPNDSVIVKSIKTSSCAQDNVRVFRTKNYFIFRTECNDFVYSKIENKFVRVTPRNEIADRYFENKFGLYVMFDNYKDDEDFYGTIYNPKHGRIKVKRVDTPTTYNFTLMEIKKRHHDSLHNFDARFDFNMNGQNDLLAIGGGICIYKDFETNGLIDSIYIDIEEQDMLSIVDINNDGRLDFLGVNGIEVTALMATEDGFNESYRTFEDLYYGVFYSNSVLLDINNDGLLDLLVQDQKLVYSLQNIDGSFQDLKEVDDKIFKTKWSYRKNKIDY